MALRAPHLHEVLRSFCLAAFARLGGAFEQAAELPFVVEEHGGLYEYRPLVRDHVQARAHALAALPDARIAVEELAREPAAAVLVGEGRAFETVLLPLLVRTAEACGGFDWEDGSFERAYEDLERTLFGPSRSYAALAPLVGLSVRAAIELGGGIRVRHGSPDALREQLPDGLEAALELERELVGSELCLPDAPAELGRAVTSLRLATGAPAAAGPAVLERLDAHPLATRAMPWLAATEPAGEATLLDPWRAQLAAELLGRLGDAEGDGELADAVERWELALLEAEPLRSERVRESLAALLGGSDGLWAAVMRASILLGEPGQRRDLNERLRALARGGEGGDEVVDALRRAIVETLLHEDRERLLETLDDALLGLRPRPAGFFSARAYRRESGTAA